MKLLQRLLIHQMLKKTKFYSVDGGTGVLAALEKPARFLKDFP